MREVMLAPPVDRAVLLQPHSKHPVEGWSWLRARTPDEVGAHGGNFGVRTGDSAGFSLWVLDFDFKADGLDALAAFEEAHGRVPGRRVRTGGGGLHIYLWGVPGQRSCRLPAPGTELLVELKANGSYVVAPGAVHPNGETYEPEEPSEWGRGLDFPVAPGWLVALARRSTTPVATGQGRRGGLARTGLGSIPTEVYVPALIGEDVPRDRKVICPWHDDHEPTLHCDYDGHWYCSVCEVGGRIRQMAARAIGVGEKRGHSWRIEAPEDRAAVDAHLAGLFPKDSRADQ
jgi:hypothetical protein